MSRSAIAESSSTAVTGGSETFSRVACLASVDPSTERAFERAPESPSILTSTRVASSMTLAVRFSVRSARSTPETRFLCVALARPTWPSPRPRAVISANAETGSVARRPRVSSRTRGVLCLTGGGRAASTNRDHHLRGLQALILVQSRTPKQKHTTERALASGPSPLPCPPVEGRLMLSARATWTYRARALPPTRDRPRGNATPSAVARRASRQICRVRGNVSAVSPSKHLPTMFAGTLRARRVPRAAADTRDDARAPTETRRRRRRHRRRRRPRRTSRTHAFARASPRSTRAPSSSSRALLP